MMLTCSLFIFKMLYGAEKYSPFNSLHLFNLSYFGKCILLSYTFESFKKFIKTYCFKLLKCLKARLHGLLFKECKFVVNMTNP